jgi:flagellar M-ring protein FliF
MSEFFKQIISQLAAVWQRLSLQQRIITVALVAFTFLGLVGLILFAQGTPEAAGFRVLYSDLAIDEAAEITRVLDDGGYTYKLENDGRTIQVKSKELYEVRMSLAREGLPKNRGIGYELFDKQNLGMTDYVQKMNSRRALEGELQRTIEGLEEVKGVRVHIVIPEKTIFLDQQKDTKASVVLKMKPGAELAADKIRGITHLVANAVDGLETGNISIIDQNGRLLSNPYGQDKTALTSSRNMELQQNIEKYLENKASDILEGVMGPGKARVKVTADLDFDQVERTLESYNPESRVVRSEERNEENTKNAPDGDHQREKSLTNYEIDKSIEHVVAEIGNIKRMTVSVVLDGKYEAGEKGKRNYVERTPEYMGDIEAMVKNAVGYDLARGDQITVANVQFDNEFLQTEQQQMIRQEQWEMYMGLAKYVLVGLIVIALVLFLRSFARTLADAMNPPAPEMVALGINEEVPEEVPEEYRRSTELLERVEMLTREEPINIASIIRDWINEPVEKGKKK